ncbi:ABC transporter ATP-binding protein [Geminicoccus flavidas]|uniref:ABC transporter ATP-binding protein n=1 Tax=Geminicoccus flavidas TaxID=2506407 RepID=UPI001356A2F4|nr:ABC transporter ATP-binding protein [Geminicoccus flavidas]
MKSVSLHDVRKSYGGVDAVKGISFEVAKGEFMGILGPSGCGKSSTLRMIAGLEDITSGELRFDGVVVNELSPKDRGIGMGFENYALYQPLTVRENIAFPLEARGVSRAEIAPRVQKMAKLMEVEDVLDRKPYELSGGQQQRVSLARALVRDPSVLLLDEPLSHMDRHARVRLRARIRHIHDAIGATSIYVTHDQEEAVALCDRVAVMNFGDLQQIGSVEELWHRPKNRFVAGFLGQPAMNFIPAVTVDRRRLRFEVEGQPTIEVRQTLPEPGRRVTFGIRPEHVRIDGEDATIPGRVVLVEMEGDVDVITIDVGGIELKTRTGAHRALAPGDQVRLAFPAESRHVFDGEDDAAPALS